jgi:predicted dehydrogenase
MKVKIFGAGSIGSHLAQACRRAGWDVLIVDTDPLALKRTKEETYPDRYGAWDDSIQLSEVKDAKKGGFDVILIGTPPDTHLKIATQVLKEEPPKVLQIEKPLCTPTLKDVPEFIAAVKNNPETAIIVGYDHIVAENTKKAEEEIKQRELGKLLSLDCEFRSHWKNIFKAHHWLSGPQDTYLGYWQRGGGAGGEHSHGLNLWQHFAHFLGAGRIKEVEAVFDFVKENGTDYDRSCFLNLITESGLIGRVAQDVITLPKKKFLSLQFEKGSLEWRNDVTKTTDEIMVQEHGKDEELFEIKKTRPDEFYLEIIHIQDILEGKIKESPISLQRGLDTMAVLAAAHKSFKEKKIIPVEYWE